jgi:hypothetical protein
VSGYYYYGTGFLPGQDNTGNEGPGSVFKSYLNQEESAADQFILEEGTFYLLLEESS